MPISKYQKNQIANREFGRSTIQSPTHYWLALGLSSSNIIEGTSGNITGFIEPLNINTGYSRISFPNSKTSMSVSGGYGPGGAGNTTNYFDNAIDGLVKNAQEGRFFESIVPWGTIKYWGIFDVSTVGSGNLLYWGELSEEKYIGSNDLVIVPAGALQFQVDNPSDI